MTNYKYIISYILHVLNHYPVSTGIYILACLCPRETTVLDVQKFDMSQPHQHKVRKNNPLRLNSYDNLLLLLKLYSNIIPSIAYENFWLDLSGCWLLSCPIDPYYYQEDENGKEIYCQRLRNELIDWILNLN
jgi:hypothetical protein